MANVAAIDAFTGPGRRVTLVEGQVEELTFRMKKKVVEVTNARGEMGSYDMAQFESITITGDGVDFSLAVTSKGENDGTTEAADAERAKLKPEGQGIGKDPRKDPIREGDGASKITPNSGTAGKSGVTR